MKIGLEQCASSDWSSPTHRSAPVRKRGVEWNEMGSQSLAKLERGKEGKNAH
ncbi:MAG: hypothetical protein IJ693_10320 [Bacteroidaceae bacterium]|nr:hypothetical protein [Bacteroidaceae bacterium]